MNESIIGDCVQLGYLSALHTGWGDSQLCCCRDSRVTDGVIATQVDPAQDISLVSITPTPWHIATLLYKQEILQNQPHSRQGVITMGLARLGPIMICYNVLRNGAHAYFCRD